ncbi:MAG: hypothetical protein IT340_10905 [Chloroflexi bacterium]|nr:hypothetical protein [Chloroflexota bacterium]
MDTEYVTNLDAPAWVSAVERRDRRAVRAWLEDAWRHGEVVNDDDGLEVAPLNPRHNRFSTSSTDLVQ